MTVLETQSRTRPAVRWTEVCATEHTGATSAVGVGAATRPTDVVTAGRAVTHRRRMPARATAGDGVRACRVASPDSAVVDDVPAWALLTCGVLFGIVLLVALALLGGPAYA